MKNKELKDLIYNNIYQNASEGYVLTPSELAFEMVSTLPNDVFVSSDTTFLDPICKSGTFLFEIAERLYNQGHSIGNIEKRIYTIDNNSHSLNVANSYIKKILNKESGSFSMDFKSDFTESFFNSTCDIVSGGRFKTFNEFINRILIEKNKSYLMTELKLNVSEFIERYEKVSKLESKLFGEVFTPRQLIDEMLDTLPSEVWTNKDLKWLDPAVGIGNFPAAIVDRLMVGLKDEIPVDSDRYKWIMEEMLYMCDISIKNLFLLYKLFDANNEFKLNVYRGSFLKEGFDKHMKEVWGLEGFDVFVGNPPYQLGKDSNFYVKFINKYKLISNKSSYLLFVVPNRFFQPSHRAHLAMKDFKILKLFHSLEKHFPGISTHIGAFLLQNSNSNYGDLVDCIFSGGLYRIDFSKPIPTDPRLSDPIYQEIIGKFLNFEKKLGFNRNKDNDNMIFIKRQWKRWNSVTKVGGDHVFNVILDYDINRDGSDGKWVYTDNYEKMEWYLSKSNIIRFITKSFASAMNVPPFIWTIIPDVDLSKINSDEDLYSLFKLNNEEINCIEKNLK